MPINGPVPRPRQPNSGPCRFPRTLMTCSLAVLLLGTGCLTPRAASSQPPPGRPGRQEPPVAVQKEWTPAPSLVRGALGVPWLEQADLQASVEELASPAFEGRLTGTPGYARAARYAAERFRTSGLQPGGADGTYFQPFTVEANEITAPVTLRISRDDWVGPTYVSGRDFVARGFSGSGDIRGAGVVFVGYGLRDASHGRDDFAGADLAGKVALMYMGAPRGEGDWGEMSRPRYKTTVAAGLGAVGVLFIDDPGADAVSPVASVYHGQLGEQQAHVPQLSIRDSVVDDLLHGRALRADTLRRQVDEGLLKTPLPLQAKVDIHIEARYEARAQTWNVVGWVQGSDPSVADEYVIVGGHLDHVGHQGAVIFAGAKDNAAGSAMVLALAEAMNASPIKPRRSVCFVLFAGEELFLLGSEYFAAHPPRPLAQARGMINLDVVGVGPQLRVEGGASTPAFQQMVVDADRLYGGFGLLDARPTPAQPGASDHSAFVNAGVPTLYFHSGGAPGRAHTSDDVASTIDFEAYERTTRVVYLTLFQMADRP